MGREHNHNRFSPIEYIPHGADLTRVIEAFAHEKRLACDTYYRNLPVWIVRDSAPALSINERIRRVQVTAYLVGTQPFLSMVASFNIVVDDHKILVPKHAPAKRMPLKEVLTDRKLDRIKLWTVLQEAWETTENCLNQPEELMPVQI